MTFVYAGSLLTHFAVGGAQDGPPVVFINSLGTDLRLWDQVVAQLGDGYRVVRYDKRGHGLSDTPPGPYSLDDFVADLRALLEQLQILSVALVGISIGGLIALGYALRYPEGVSRLILSDTAARLGTDQGWEHRMQMVNELGMAKAAAAIIPVWFANSFAAVQPAAHRGYLNMLARTPTDGYIASCAALRDSDLTHQLGAIRADTLVLTGEHDVATPPDQGRALAGAIPGAGFRLIAAAGHLPCIEQPAAMAQTIRDFLEESGDA